jgi:hypothetical protein
MFKSRKQILTRFLKDNKIYHRIISSNKINMIYPLLGKKVITVRFFDDGMCWGNTKEGHNFWLKMQCEFLIFIAKYDFNKCFTECEVREYLSTLTSKGYFSDVNGDFSKNGNYYKYISRFLKENFVN